VPVTNITIDFCHFCVVVSNITYTVLAMPYSRFKRKSATLRNTNLLMLSK